MNCCCDKKEQVITIIKGNDTNANGTHLLSIYLTDALIDLSSATATFTLCGITQTFEDLSEGVIHIDYTNQQTGQMPVGINYGTLNILENGNIISTLDNMIAFNVVKNVHGNALGTQPYHYTFEVKQSGQTILNVSVEAGVSVEVGTTTTLPAGSDATVTNAGTPNHLVLNFGIPRGEKGDDGAEGPEGPEGPAGKDAKINGYNSIALLGSNGVSITQNGSETIVSGETLQEGITNINDLIPSQATEQNQLADKAFVNSSINNLAAYYITSDVAGDPFATRAALVAGPWYFRGELRQPTQNDYALVSQDETHEDMTSRFMYDGNQWVWQYTLNNTQFTQAQIDAINSGITSSLVTKIGTNESKIGNLSSLSTSVKSDLVSAVNEVDGVASGKQDALTAGVGVDITDNTIGLTNPALINTATGTDSLTILGVANTGNRAVNIGPQSQGGYYTTSLGYGSACTGGMASIAIGYLTNVTAASATSVGTQSEVSALFGIALGRFAKATAPSAIQIGYGTNSEANSFYVATSDSNNWKILGSDGKIPEERLPNIPIMTASTAGVAKLGPGLQVGSSGDLKTYQASDSEIDAKSNAYKPITPAKLDYATKVGLTTNTITMTDAEKKSARDWQGIVNSADLIPDFDSMTPIETHTFDISTTDYYELFTKPNDAGTFDNPTDAQFEVWCRITTTNKEGTSTNPRIYQELDCVFREFGTSTQVVYGVIRSKPESVTAATTGIQTMRSVYPKAINSGKQWAVEAKPYNSTARTVTVKVYKTATGVSWKDTDVISTYDTNHQTSLSVNAYNSPGYLFLGPITGAISSASTAGYITSSLQKTLASSTLKNTGYMITGNSLLFKIKGQALLSGISETNAPVDIEFGICQSGVTAAATSTSTYAYTSFYQKHQFTPASSVNFAEAYENGDLIYARFTLSNGNLYSDNICSKYPTAGHTWYCIGMATSATAINFDNTGSHFLTYNDEGKLTHIDGRKISTRDIVTDTDSATITLANAEAGVDYHYGTITSLTVTANDTSADETNIYFTAGASISVSLPNTLKFIGSTPTFSPNKQYVLSIANNILISGEVS